MTATEEAWRRETERYSSRVRQLNVPLEGTHSLFEQLPVAPISYEPSQAGLISLLLANYVAGCVGGAHEFSRAFQSLWSNGLFLSASQPARQLIELWGATAFAREVLRKMSRTGDFEVAKTKTQRLLFGSRTEIKIPWGGMTEDSPFNVMEFVRAAKNSDKTVYAEYEFLCDAIHPNYLQQNYLLMAGSVLGNWSNKAFAAHAHEILNRTLSAAERAVVGITEECGELMPSALRYINIDREHENSG